MRPLNFTSCLFRGFAASAETTPLLHKLLLLRDVIREELGLPGGLHEPARPDAFDDLDDHLKALWTYRHGPAAPTGPAALSYPATAGVDFISLPPLVVAATRGNADAINLLLLFGEGVHARRKGNDRALYAACEQGNIACVAALLGRAPLRPPSHPSHIARRLGLIRPRWKVMGPGLVYSAGVTVGPQNVPAAISAAKIRAEMAAATGMATNAGPKASATAVAKAKAIALAGGSAGAGSKVGEGSADANMSTIEAMVAQQQLFENDGRYRSWCRGYHVGTYWSLYDTSLASYEAIHGPIGVVEPAGGEPARPGTASTALVARPPALVAIGAAAARSLYAAKRISATLFNVSEVVNAVGAPGSLGPLVSGKRRKEITPAYAAQALLTSRLSPGLLLPTLSRPRKRGHIHSCLPPVVDYGQVAAETISIKVRINVGPAEGRTPLFVACER